MAKTEPKTTGETGETRVVYYAADGSEYPVIKEHLTPVEETNLRAWGYSTEKPTDVDAEAAQVPIPDGGPLSGAVTS